MKILFLEKIDPYVIKLAKARFTNTKKKLWGIRASFCKSLNFFENFDMKLGINFLIFNAILRGSRVILM